MVILEMYQGEYKKELVAFNSLEEGRAFVAQIPGYTLEKEDEFDMESFNPATYRIIWRLSITEALYPCLAVTATLLLQSQEVSPRQLMEFLSGSRTRPIAISMSL